MAAPTKAGQGGWVNPNLTTRRDVNAGKLLCPERLRRIRRVGCAIRLGQALHQVGVQRLRPKVQVPGSTGREAGHDLPSDPGPVVALRIDHVGGGSVHSDHCLLVLRGGPRGRERLRRQQEQHHECAPAAGVFAGPASSRLHSSVAGEGHKLWDDFVTLNKVRFKSAN